MEELGNGVDASPRRFYLCEHCRNLPAQSRRLGHRTSAFAPLGVGVAKGNGPERNLVSGHFRVRAHGALAAATHAAQLLASAARFRPFNLLTFDGRDGFYLGNRPQPRAQAITPGVHGLSNADFNTPWPKTRNLMQRVRQWVDEDGDDGFDPLFEALADERPAPDAELPQTGVGLERERLLSAAFIRGERYGTRASTVVAIDRHGAGVIVERRYGPNGRMDGQSSLPIGGAG